MKRILLFLVTNFAVMFVMMIAFTVICNLLGLDTAMLSKEGINYPTLAVFSLVYGMLGSVISLLMSKTIAKMTTKAQTINGTEGAAEAWLVSTVKYLADRAGVQCPEVAIYPGEPNAFATGAFKNHALVAVSTGIMESMTKNELKAVLGHEMSHVANGDMVTMTLVQGVLNAVVIFMSRLAGLLLARDSRGRGRGNGIAFLVQMVLQVVLGFLASIIVYAFSRHREYEADAGSARLLGSPSDMIAALQRLGNLQPGILPDSLKAMGISGKSMRSLLSTHPSLEDRIAALRQIGRR